MNIELPAYNGKEFEPLPSNIKIVSINGRLVLFKYWFGRWQQLSTSQQEELKIRHGIHIP